MKCSITFLSLFLTISFLNAQGVVVYEPFSAKDSLDPHTDIKIDKNCIKWNLTLLGRGGFAFDYERLLLSTLTIELETGLTYRDYIYEGLQSLDDDMDFYNYEDKVSFGYLVSAALKYYPVEGDLEGLYFSPLIRYRSYNIDRAFEINNSSTYYPYDYNMTDYGFVVGVQAMNWSQLVAEIYFGVSYRTANTISYSAIYDNSNYIIDYEKQRHTDQSPVLLFGYKIGFAF